MTSPLDWHPAVRDILGMQDDVNPSRVRTNTWIKLNMSYWEARQVEMLSQLMKDVEEINQEVASIGGSKH